MYSRIIENSVRRYQICSSFYKKWCLYCSYIEINTNEFNGNSEIKREDVVEFIKSATNQQFEVQGCEMQSICSPTGDNDYLRSEIVPIGVFLNPEIEESYNKFDLFLIIQFNYNDYALHRHNEGLPDKGTTKISL